MEGIDISMRELYNSVEKQLDRINYDLIWPRFYRKGFAIYNKTRVFLPDTEIPYDERFLGNTSINYNGEDLAIVHVDNPDKENAQELASLIVHEMFHSYQILNGESRFPNDLRGLDYPRDLKNYEIKYRENKLIVKALNTSDNKIKLNILKEFIALRNMRLSEYGDIIKYELAIETVEGTAEFCGTKALKQISKEAYEKRIENYKNILLEDIGLLFDIRKISYYVGNLFLLLLEELGLSFKGEIRGQNKYIFEEIADKIDYDLVDFGEINEPQLEKYYNKHIEEIKTKFKDFYGGDIKKFTGNFIICGYDPMNMIKEGDEIFCSNFIMIMDGVTSKKLFLKGPLVIKLKEGSYNQSNEYYM